ncbi:MAG: aldehyde dehydrogenase family protein, partial [Burkholderiales bacterium]
MNKPTEMKAAESVPLWINGRRQAASSSRFGDVTNPATGQIVRQVPFCNAEDIAAAVAAAKAAFPGWRDTPPLRRARILMRYRELIDAHRDELAKLITEEHGKTLPDAAGSVQRGLEVVEFATGIPHLMKGEYSEEVGTNVDTHSLRQPLGVCAGITPFNFPAMVPLWMYPVAIACGNTFVLKPSEKVPSTAMRLAELFKEAGLPDGVLNVVHGDKAAVDALLMHADVKAISFVGSTPI